MENLCTVRGNLWTSYTINYSDRNPGQQEKATCLSFGPNIEYKKFMEKSQEFLRREFIHLLSDTLALLGAEKRLIEDIKAAEENPFSPKIIDEIRQYNCEQKIRAKDSAALLNITFSYP